MIEFHISEQWFHLRQRAFLLTVPERQAGIAFIQETMRGASDKQFYRADPHDTLERLQQIEATRSAIEVNSAGAIGLPEAMIRLFLQFEANSLQSLTAGWLTGMSLAHDFSIEERVKAAQNDPIAFDVACKYGGIYVNTGEVMPPVLRKFIYDVLTQRITRPSEKRGGNPFEHLRRNQTIIEAIEIGQHYGLQATRNDASEEVSGCDIVAAQLRDMELSPSTFAGVKRIWMRRGSLNAAFLRTMTGQDP